MVFKLQRLVMCNTQDGIMNSRQRRKAAADEHNMLLAKQEAYIEDRIRDPEKYNKLRRKQKSARGKASVIMTAAMSLSYFKAGSV